MNRTRIAHVTHSMSREAGGLFESVRCLSQQFHLTTGVEIKVFGLADSHSADDLEAWRPLQTQVYASCGPAAFGFAPGMADGIHSFAPDMIHVHGIWKYPTIAVNQWHKRTGRPYIVSPHGMLEPWSLSQSRLKKRLATIAYQGMCLRRAFCLRATSELEAESIRKAGYSKPIAVVPNGVRIPEGVASLRNRGPGPQRALFLSRIHPKKGLLNLVAAWERVNPAGWQLDIAGPDECGHLAEVKEAVKRARLEETVRFVGEIWGDAKFQTYANSDLFILPTFSENFGLVIAEALGSGVPVITTRATPWEELSTHRCGWWVDVGVAPLEEAIRQATKLAPDTLREYGRRGMQLVSTRYSWPAVTDSMVWVIEWVLGRQQPPENIRFS